MGTKGGLNQGMGPAGNELSGLVKSHKSLRRPGKQHGGESLASRPDPATWGK